MSTFNKHIDSFINMMDLHKVAQDTFIDYMNVEDVAKLTPLNPTYPEKVDSIVNSIIDGTFESPPLLYVPYLSRAVTGSHRIQACRKLEELDKASDWELGYAELQIPVIDVTDYIESYAEREDITFEDLPFDDLRLIFEGTELEPYVIDNKEW